MGNFRILGGPGGCDREYGFFDINDGASTAVVNTDLSVIYGCNITQVEGTAQDSVPVLRHTPTQVTAGAMTGTQVGVELSATTVTFAVVGTVARTVVYAYELYGVS